MGMGQASNISGSIIESLYSHALVLSDEVRATFSLQPMNGEGALQDGTEDPLRIALSTEGLRTTTRMMHVLAWLLNQRAFCSGEMTEFQLRRHGCLPDDRTSDPELVHLLELPTQELIEETEAFHSRIARLDRAWRERFEMQPTAVMRLRERLGERLGHAAKSDLRKHLS